MSRKIWFLLPLLGIAVLFFGGFGAHECTIELALTGEQSSVSADLWDLEGQSIAYFRLEGSAAQTPWVVRTKESHAKIEVQWTENGKRKNLTKTLEMTNNSKILIHLN